MDASTNRRATLLWSLGFAAAYLVLAVAVSVLADRRLHLAAWLPALVLWLTGALLNGGPLLHGGVGAPRPPSPGRPARVAALRWVLCVLVLANAALLLWRAFQPGDSTLVVAGLPLRLLPLDVRWVLTGLDPLSLALGAGLGFLGLCELRLRLATGPSATASAA
jgi:hypothetical protein